MNLTAPFLAVRASPAALVGSSAPCSGVSSSAARRTNATAMARRMELSEALFARRSPMNSSLAESKSSLSSARRASTMPLTASVWKPSGLEASSEAKEERRSRVWPKSPACREPAVEMSSSESYSSSEASVEMDEVERLRPSRE